MLPSACSAAAPRAHKPSCVTACSLPFAAPPPEGPGGEPLALRDPRDACAPAGSRCAPGAAGKIPVRAQEWWRRRLHLSLTGHACRCAGSPASCCSACQTGCAPRLACTSLALAHTTYAVLRSVKSSDASSHCHFPPSPHLPAHDTAGLPALWSLLLMTTPASFTSWRSTPACRYQWGRAHGTCMAPAPHLPLAAASPRAASASALAPVLPAAGTPLCLVSALCLTRRSTH